MSFDIILFALPLVAFARLAKRQRYGFPYFIAAAYVYPLLAITAMNNEGALPGATMGDGIATPLRAAIHPVIGALLLAIVIMRGGRLRVIGAFIAAYMTICWMLVSTWINGGDAASVERPMLNLLFVANTLLLVPAVVGKNREEFIEGIARSAVFLSLFFAIVSIFAIVRYGFWPVWSPRLGRPLNPNVLAYLTTAALCASYLYASSQFTRILLLVIVFLTASRINVALGFSIYGVGLFTQSGRAGRRLVAIAGVVVSVGVAAVVYVDSLQTSPSTATLFARSGLTSGRSELWRESAANIAKAPIFGSGDRTLLSTVSDGNEDIRVHNMSLELAMSYGVPAAFLALGLYGMVVFDTVRTARRLGIRRKAFLVAGVGLIADSLANGMFATSSWMNLADGSAVLFLLLCACVANLRPPVRGSLACDSHGLDAEAGAISTAAHAT
jgi:hypothetical protein